MISLLVVSALVMAGPGLGFGVGQTLGGHLLMPSLFTMRIGAGEPFIIAPELNVSYSSDEDDIDSTKGSDFVFGLESNFHRAFWKKGGTGFYGIFGLGVEISKQTSQWYEYVYPDSAYRLDETTDSRTFGLNLGLGMEQFFRDNLSVCMSSLSNLSIESQKRKREENGLKTVIFDRSGYTFDFQNLRCNIYLVWYL